MSEKESQLKTGEVPKNAKKELEGNL